MQTSPNDPSAEAGAEAIMSMALGVGMGAGASEGIFDGVSEGVLTPRRRGRIAKACSQCHTRKQKVQNLCRPRVLRDEQREEQSSRRRTRRAAARTGRPPPRPRPLRQGRAGSPSASPSHPLTPASATTAGTPSTNTAPGLDKAGGLGSGLAENTIENTTAPRSTSTRATVEDAENSQSLEAQPDNIDEGRPQPRNSSGTTSVTGAGSASQPGPTSTGTTTNTGAGNVAPLGQLWKSRGAPTFFGSSYFGPQAAAALLDTSAPYVQPGANMSLRSSIARPFRDEGGPFSQLWDLLGMLPRQRSTVDRLVDQFLAHVSVTADAVHPASFRREYERFYSRRAGFDDVTTVDIRWLALLFIVLAIGTYLDCPGGAPPEVQREYEDASMSFFWACRRAIVIAPSFYGESTDLVRAGILATRYCLFSQRITEGWLTAGFASRLAIAQGVHIDGTHWKLPRRVTEARRRLWCHLYLLDRMISLALGRPYCILDNLSLTQEPENVFLDDLGHDEANAALAEPLTTHPTPSVLAIFSYRLARIIGRIQEQTFGLRAASYREVMRLDAQLLAWKQSLPAYFALEDTDVSLDSSRPFLKWHRLYLHTAFHFSRITLHRPYAWRISVTDQHRYSREVCYASACADLKTRLEHDVAGEGRGGPADHYVWCLGAPQLFNSAIVLGLLAIQEQPRPFPRTFPRTGGSVTQRTKRAQNENVNQTRVDIHPVVNDLQAFCDKERNEIWVNDFRLAEVKVAELCIERLRRRAGLGETQETSLPPQEYPQPPEPGPEREPEPEPEPEPEREPLAAAPAAPMPASASAPLQPGLNAGLNGFPTGGTPANAWQPLLQDVSLSPWDPNAAWLGTDFRLRASGEPPFSEAFSFPGPTDLVTWQDMIDAIDSQQYDGPVPLGLPDSS
ncbi:hypothetical protein SPBR_08135 [Sporothrix brasiliensis 5110]|uniref:Xylanolytic transcriptional activator regulatory domain-containing protein n=1 Tax=Sporothrix brasiliensis 5110 TaxID=1398154 RepID=A0A0C2EK87_9PEZI|nr:uncharacterized protein SPBR_08135 [Sporothrix brasiliensis 5110]KIH86504.1 hypothetical protein SPBR_08135 [Sporothrix brasiliensis 5110]